MSPAASAPPRARICSSMANSSSYTARWVSDGSTMLPPMTASLKVHESTMAAKMPLPRCDTHTAGSSGADASIGVPPECRVEAAAESRLVAPVLPFECKARTQNRTGDKSAIPTVLVHLPAVCSPDTVRSWLLPGQIEVALHPSPKNPQHDHCASLAQMMRSPMPTPRESRLAR